MQVGFIEMSVLQAVKHRGVISIIKFMEDIPAGIMEYAEKGSLENYLKKLSQPIECGQRLLWTLQLIKAIEYLHHLGMIHRDIRCANILLDGDLNIKLSDFGVCFWPSNKNVVTDVESEKTVDFRFDLRLFGIVLLKTLLCGTEVNLDIYDYKTDSVIKDIPCGLPSFRQLIDICFNSHITTEIVVLFTISIIAHFKFMILKQ